MNPVFVLLSFLFSLLLSPNFASAKDDKSSCACEPVQCGPCQKQVVVGTNVKFCDWGEINVCRDVICENVSFYFSCLSKLDESKKKEEQGAEDQVQALTLDYEEDGVKLHSSSRGMTNRTPASVKKKAKKKVVSQSAFPPVIKTEGRKEVGNTSRVDTTPAQIFMGEVDVSSAGIKVFHRGQTGPMKNKEKLYVGDEITNVSGQMQKFTLNFQGGRVHFELHDKTKLSVEDPHSLLGRFQPFLYLVHGGVDYKVEISEGSFDLLAGQILVRSSSGHQQVAYKMEERGLVVRVESLTNGLEVLRARDLSGKTISVAAGQFLSWVSETPHYLFSQDEKAALAGEGFVTPVFNMPPARKKELGILPVQEQPLFADWQRPDAEKKGERGLASLGDELCQAPSAKYQQCAWSCEGNPSGASSCQAQMDNVHCVRRVCNAAGQWGAPTPFASSYRDLCPAQGVRVGHCGP
jgi:hypothetical protein